jgi:hypothetical protein
MHIENGNYTNNWLDVVESDFKLQINDKVCLFDGSFQSSLFFEQNRKFLLDVKEELKQSLNTGSTEDKFGYYHFIISDIEYMCDVEDGIYCDVSLK